MQPLNDETDLYEAVGASEQPFFDLVERFYIGVESDPALRALYPVDLGPGKQRLAWFLIQRFGGPEHFNQRRGAPMLRRRHVEFAIDPEQARRWFEQMGRAIDSVAVFVPYKAVMLRYFEDAAMFLINRDPRAETSPQSHPVEIPIGLDEPPSGNFSR